MHVTVAPCLGCLSHPCAGCSHTNITVRAGKTYLLRLINAASLTYQARGVCRTAGVGCELGHGWARWRCEWARVCVLPH